jgi:class 3 adenylate cyclase
LSALQLRIYSGPRLLILAAGQTVSLGRAHDSTVRLENPGVSGHHGVFVPTPQGYVYRDTSRNGTVVSRNGTAFAVHDLADRETLLLDGDVLAVGAQNDPVRLRVAITGPMPEPTQQQITSGASMADLDAIHRRVETDQRALVCLYQVVRELASVRSRARLLQTLSDLILRHFDKATHVAVFRRDEDDGYETVHAAARAGVEQRTAPPSRTLLQHLEKRDEAVLFLEGGELYDLSASLVANKIRSGICVPLHDRERMVGALQVDSEQDATGVFHEKDLELMTLIASQASLRLENLDMIASLTDVNQRLGDALARVEMLDRAKEYLGKYVPWAVRKRAEDPPDLEASMVATAATILFLDIGGYTKLTEALSQKEVGWLIETYFSAYIDAIQANGGDVNETAGDGLMIIFRSSDVAEHACAAVRTAVAVRHQTRVVNGQMEKFDPIDVNIGIESGHVTVGSRKIEGLAGARWTYTATGMVTNLAARIAAHATNGRIFIGPSAADAVADAFALREGGEVHFKNVSHPVRVFEVMDGLDTGV